ncbi:MAG: radical SAM protein [Chloroflexi bacterium]|nr:radical SAM protein [Chloroflexota bacterium]
MAQHQPQNERRILLVEPPFYRLYDTRFGVNIFPLSLGYLSAAIMSRTSWKVQAYNAEFSGQQVGISIDFLMKKGYKSYLNSLENTSGGIWEEVKAAIADFAPDVLGITCKSQNFASVRIVARLAKEIDKEIIVVVGGPHPSMDGVNVMKCPDIDICVRGEGEETAVELLSAIDEGKDWGDVSGIMFRKNGDVCQTPPRSYIGDLDSLPFPHEVAPEVLKDYSRYPLTAFHRIFAIRGCPFNCSFCGSRYVWSRRARHRSVENVVRQIQSLQKMGLTFIHFDDDTFGVNKEYIRDLCHAIKSNCPGLTWGSEIHVNLVDRETIGLMKSAGCVFLQLGIESGSNRMLELIRKGITVEKALSVCEMIKGVGGIHLNTFFMAGFPQETEETLRDTCNVMEAVKCDSISFSIFTPYPGTELFELCKERGLIGSDFDISLYNHQSPNNYFCPNIPRQKFRELVSEMVRLVDAKNRRGTSLFRRVRELGLRESFRRFKQRMKVGRPA